jgi:hypothetical protein
MRRSDREVNESSLIEAIIQKADVCRLALVDNGKPYIVALNFGYLKEDPNCIYFHCAHEGRKIDIIKKNNQACFQMDVDHELLTAKKACGYTMKFKSIVGYGKITIVESKLEKIKGLNAIMKQYTKQDQFEYPDKMLDITTILKLEIEEIKAKVKE